MKAAACPQGYYEEDQVTEEAMQLHHVGTTQTTTYKNMHATRNFCSQRQANHGNQQTEEERRKRRSEEAVSS